MLYQQVRRPFWRRHPIATATAVALGAWLLVDGWYLTVAAIAAIVLWRSVRRHRRALANRDAGLRARADYEHRLCLAGDPHGVFGRYPPFRLDLYPAVSDVRAVVHR